MKQTTKQCRMQHHLLPPPHSTIKGFSLVELSIVLVILGLLTGGILGGQALMRAAELRSVTNEFQQYQVAVHTFKDKYFALPGDMKTATRFWGADAGCGAGGAGSNTTPGYQAGAPLVGTCNGDGNGNITNSNTVSNYYESLLFWQHLQLAGLIPGSYTGLRGPDSTYHHVLGANSPKSKMSNGGWSMFSYTLASTGTERFRVEYNNVFQFGAVEVNKYTSEPLLTPEEAWNIDSKTDDGKPGQGKVIARYYLTCANAAANTDFDADYDLSDNAARCVLYFRDAV